MLFRSITFPDKVMSYIEMQGCTGLTSVTFPDKVMGYIDMRGCTGLTSITFPDKVMGSIYMQGCTGLTSITFPDKVMSYIYMQGCTGLTSVTFPDKVTGYIYMDDRCSEALLSMQHKRIIYRISAVQFNRDLFDKVRHDDLSAQEVFSITNMEQRRIAYERMDKIKMKDMPGFKTLHEVADDGRGYPMKVVSFTVEGYNEPFKFLNCFCPSTGREYFLETKQDTCEVAKAKSFGFDRLTFDEEY